MATLKQSEARYVRAVAQRGKAAVALAEASQKEAQALAELFEVKAEADGRAKAGANGKAKARDVKEPVGVTAGAGDREDE